MEVKCLPLGLYQTNCYLLIKDDHVIIIDPAKKEDRIIEAIKDRHVDAILLTHGHFDHIGAVDKLAAYYKCPIYLDEDDEKLVLNCPYNSYEGYSGKIISKTNRYSYPYLNVGDFKFEIIKASGHTDGSVLLICEDLMFAGDVIFKESIGRTDLYSGNDSKMRQTLKLIKTLNPNLIIYPGHGESTILKNELLYNYFLR